MFAVNIELLTGRFVGSRHNDREQPEWPPHPARLFSAMTDAWGSNGENTAEAEALDWLSSLEPPQIMASSATPRRSVQHFVPVNDPKKKDVLPENRLKQARTFASVTPECPQIAYVWNETIPKDKRNVLDGLLERVVRLGHSSSLTSCYLSETDIPEHTWEPDPSGEMFRWVGKGQREALCQEHARHKGTLPRGSLPSVSVSYVHKDAKPPPPQNFSRPNTYGKWLVFEFLSSGKSISPASAADVSSVLRKAVMCYLPASMPSSLSGHTNKGKPALDPHLGFACLPWVGHPRSDGRLMGCCINIPGSIPEKEARELYLAIGKWERKASPLHLTFGKCGIIEMQRTSRPDAFSLQFHRWSKPSTLWTSATPIALPCHPGRLSGGSDHHRKQAWAKAEEGVRKSIDHVGLPEPEEVVLSQSPFISGVRHTKEFPVFKQGGKSREEVHALIRWAEPVGGPMFLGSGRFLGLGLMCPMDEEWRENAEE